MPVFPGRLEGVTADKGVAAQAEGAGRVVSDVRLLDLAVDVGLALATGAGTGTAHRFQVQVAFDAVVPLDGEFVANRLDVLGNEFHGCGERLKQDGRRDVKL